MLYSPASGIAGTPLARFGRDWRGGTIGTMTDPGLNDRLRQRSRRAGLMVGVSMALTIALCVGGFTVIYSVLVPVLSDVVGVEGREGTRVPSRDAAAVAVAQPSATATSDEPAAPVATEPAAPAPTATASAFQATHQIGAAESVNFRSGPSRDNPPILALTPQTPLQFLDERAPAGVPDDEPGWMKFRIESGEEGWVRQIDAQEIGP